MSFKVKVDLRRIPKKVQAIVHDPRVKLELAETWKKYFDAYAPYGTGALSDTAQIVDGGEYIEYTVPYAHYMYVGEEYIYDAYLNENGELQKDYIAPKGETKTPSADFGFSDYMIPGALESWYPRWDQRAYDIHKPDVAEHMTEFIAGL